MIGHQVCGLLFEITQQHLRLSRRRADARRAAVFREAGASSSSSTGAAGQSVSNALQTNAVLLDKNWCDLFREYQWLLGVSLDGPEEVNDRYRFNKEKRGTWKRVMQSVELLQTEKVEFNILCVLSQANVRQAARAVQVLSKPRASTTSSSSRWRSSRRMERRCRSPSRREQYGRFLCEIFDLWWPERRKMRIRSFDNIAEALAGQKPGNCTMHETCDSYVVVEFNGDVYPCDFFVESGWKLGNVNRRFLGRDRAPHAPLLLRRQEDALRTPNARSANSSSICHGGCPKCRHGPHGKFDDLDYFCGAYKMYLRQERRAAAQRIAAAVPGRCTRA